MFACKNWFLLFFCKYERRASLAISHFTCQLIFRLVQSQPLRQRKVSEGCQGRSVGACSGPPSFVSLTLRWLDFAPVISFIPFYLHPSCSYIRTHCARGSWFIKSSRDSVRGCHGFVKRRVERAKASFSLDHVSVP